MRKNSDNVPVYLATLSVRIHAMQIELEHWAALIKVLPELPEASIMNDLNTATARLNGTTTSLEREVELLHVRCG